MDIKNRYIIAAHMPDPDDRDEFIEGGKFPDGDEETYEIVGLDFSKLEGDYRLSDGNNYVITNCVVGGLVEFSAHELFFDGCTFVDDAKVVNRREKYKESDRTDIQNCRSGESLVSLEVEVNSGTLGLLDNDIRSRETVVLRAKKIYNEKTVFECGSQIVMDSINPIIDTCEIECPDMVIVEYDEFDMRDSKLTGQLTFVKRKIGFYGKESLKLSPSIKNTEINGEMTNVKPYDVQKEPEDVKER